MNRKLKVALVISFLFLIVFSFNYLNPTVASASGTVTLEGAEIVKGRTLVPLRAIFEEIGATVQWDQKNKKITATKDNRKIVLTVGSKHTSVNGKQVIIDVPAQVKNGSTLVPLRFISEKW